jgi:arylsulfatase A-like enzyme
MIPRVTRREALTLAGGAVASLLGARSVGGAAGPPCRPVPRRAPNIVMFLTDDQAQLAMSAYGHPFLKTPQMDRIAAEGVRFTEAFVTNSLCAPSRATILTGLYAHTHGVLTNGGGPAVRNQPGLKDDHVTFVQLLHQVGYHTALVGKWHLPSWPASFDEWIILPGQGVYQDPEMIAQGMRLQLRGHVDDVVGDQALTVLRHRPADRPFCLLVQFKAPHRSWVPAPRFAQAFESVEIPVPRMFEDPLDGRPEAVRQTQMALADMPDFREQGVPATLPPEERARRNLQHMVRNYCRVLLGVDENVGRVLAFLDTHGLTENTLVLFTSDNGFFLGEHGLYDKRLMYEPSIRVPMLLRFPARLAAGRVDTTHLVLNLDIAPTLLEAAGVPVPPGMHGQSWLPLLEGQESPWREAFLYQYYEYPAWHCVRKHQGVRTRDWKLIHFWEQPEEWELYELTADSDERNNLAGRLEYADRLTQLRAQLAALRREVGDVDPPGPRPTAAPCTSDIGSGRNAAGGTPHMRQDKR